MPNGTAFTEKAMPQFGYIRYIPSPRNVPSGPGLNFFLLLILSSIRASLAVIGGRRASIPADDHTWGHGQETPNDLSSKQRATTRNVTVTNIEPTGDRALGCTTEQTLRLNVPGFGAHLYVRESWHHAEEVRRGDPGQGCAVGHRDAPWVSRRLGLWDSDPVLVGP